MLTSIQPDEAHVSDNKLLQCLYTFLRHAGHLDAQSRLSQSLGVLVLQHHLWPFPSAVLRCELGVDRVFILWRMLIAVNMDSMLRP